jgi:hypothetical protein
MRSPDPHRCDLAASSLKLLSIALLALKLPSERLSLASVFCGLATGF